MLKEESEKIHIKSSWAKLGAFVIDLNGLKSNLTSALSFSDMSSYV